MKLNYNYSLKNCGKYVNWETNLHCGDCPHRKCITRYLNSVHVIAECRKQTITDSKIYAVNLNRLCVHVT